MVIFIIYCVFVTISLDKRQENPYLFLHPVVYSALCYGWIKKVWKPVISPKYMSLNPTIFILENPNRLTCLCKLVLIKLNSSNCYISRKHLLYIRMHLLPGNKFLSQTNFYLQTAWEFFLQIKFTFYNFGTMIF